MALVKLIGPKDCRKKQETFYHKTHFQLHL